MGRTGGKARNDSVTVEKETETRGDCVTPLTEAEWCQPEPSELGGFVLVDPLRARLPGLPLASLIDAGCGLRPLTVSLPISTFQANASRRLALVVREHHQTKKFWENNKAEKNGG